jgi:hypothetical protein
MRATRSSSMRFTKPQGRMEKPPVPPRRSTRPSVPPPFASWHSAYGFIIMSEEEEKKLARLKKRLVANVDFDDQALNLLGFVTDIYYMLGHLGWLHVSTYCNSLQRGVGKHPQGICLGNSYDHGAYP